MTGVHKLASSHHELIEGGPELEDPSDCHIAPMPHPIIADTDKETKARAHIAGARNLPIKAIIVYTDRSKNSNNKTASGWSVQEQLTSGLSIIKEGGCSIGKHIDIKDREVLAIQEALRYLASNDTCDREIFLFADNQNALSALAGGPTLGREYIRASLEDYTILQQQGCRMRGK